MLPTGFGKSINFQLLPRVAKALQCCDTTSLHTAYNIASPGTIYSSHLTQLLCPMHATIVSIQRRSLKTLTNEKNTIFCYSFLCKYLAAYSNSLARVNYISAFIAFEKMRAKRKKHFERAQKFAENRLVFPLYVLKL